MKVSGQIHALGALPPGKEPLEFIGYSFRIITDVRTHAVCKHGTLSLSAFCYGKESSL